MLDLGGCLPKNMNGIRTTHTCELCGFEPKTKNKYREKQDHLVMKHFKEKIDKIFPHCRPYTCPSADCSFTGKDKQALLRHYTGKHGILEKYLREALAENGIHILPAEPGTKRRSSVSSSGNGSPKMVKQARLVISPSSPIDPKDLLPTVPLPQAPRPNAEELRKEVEAMMASFQPQPIETQMVIRVPPQLQLVTVSQHQQQQQQQHNQHRQQQQQHHQQQQQQLSPNLQKQISLPEGMTTLNGNIPIKIQLPQHPEPVNVASTTSSSTALPPNLLSNSVSSTPQIVLSNSPLPSLIVSSKQHQLSLPTLSVNSIRASSPDLSPSFSCQPIPLEILTGGHGLVNSSSTTCTTASPIFISSSITSTPSSVLENKEVMWGAGLGPAVVVEAADTLPITYIETADGSYAALLDTIDYDFLIPNATSGLDVMRERQLDFCTF